MRPPTKTCPRDAKHQKSLKDSVQCLLHLLQGENLDGLGSRFGLEDARFLGEGVDSLASFGRGAALHGETSEAGNNELTTLPANEQMIINLH